MGRFFAILWVGRWLLCGGNFRCGELVFLLGVLRKTAFGCGVFVDSLWWIGWVRWIAGCRFLGGGFFAGNLWKSQNSFGIGPLRNKQRQNAKARAIDLSLRLRLRSGLRQSGGGFAAVFRRGAEAPLYLRGKGNGTATTTSTGWLGKALHSHPCRDKTASWMGHPIVIG